MRTNLSAAFLSLIAIAALVLAANVGPAVAQSTPDDPLTIKATPAAKFTRYYAPYAIQSAAAYLSVQDFNDRHLKRDSEGNGADVEYTVQNIFGGDGKHGREAFRAWQYQFGSDTPLTCIDPNDSDCQNALRNKGWDFGSGPAFHVWARTRFPHADREVCTEVSIAFRGTVGWSGGDWFSNADRFGSPYDDYYRQLRRNIDGIIGLIKNLDCYKRARNKPQIVSTGHSLGGGLAQLAALATRPSRTQITKVFAFDPSPVTGAHLIDKQTLTANAQGLTIDRIYQDGEVLSYARSAIQEFPPTRSACKPVVRTVKLDAVPGSSAFGLHGMNPLAVQIVEASYDGNKPQEYQTPLYPDRNCKVRYHSPTDEDVVASAAGPRRLASFVPNYGGYADQLGASYAYMQDGGPATKLTAARMRGVTLISRGHRSRNVDAASSYNVAAHVEGTIPFSPLPRAE
jgi:pimeloyl-ACP methyl ester carboxylesterase